MKRHWTIPEVIEHWSLAPAERALVEDTRADHTRLGLAVLLKYFQLDWRFPRSRADVPVAVVAHLAQQLGIPATAFLAYDWAGRVADHII